ncbi:protein transport protein Sec24D isoform X2 [Boleophthalmus pectinirostris]|uniref:protein transport protein Sec24D isoform X2 n=1 Tax=Boleophthalmus pectinirostris TaxID=150288 RepID=UPI00242BCBD1|nr:protein transport protein Sec24D isoform X2 [Boleophthalmus pectinirostris]
MESSANQSAASPQQWAGQNSWSPISPFQHHHNPISTFQHLTLTSPHHPESSFNHSQLKNTNWSGTCYDSSVYPAKPPSSLPLISNGSLQLQPPPPHPSQINHQSICAPVQQHISDQRLLNGPQSPLQNNSSHNHYTYDDNTNQNQLYSPFQPVGVDSAGFIQNYSSPTSPIQQQPQWTTTTPGTVKHFVPEAVGLSPSSESRYGLDPESLPSAVKVMAEDQAQWEGKVYVSEPPSRLPPLPTTSCTIEDKGSASPFAIRASTYCFPCDAQTTQLSHLPLGALISPLAGVNFGQNSLPDCTESECIAGCGSCGAFMCPAMGWQDCGQRYSCPFCGKLSEVPWQFYQPTKGVEGVRVDKKKRPELSMGSYEVIHSQKGESAVLLLAIDVSVQALRGGHLEFITHQIRTLLASLNGEDEDSLSDVRVGLMTYDSRVHLYDLSPALSRPHMLVITETDELQLPISSGLLVPLKDCVHSVNSVLQLIPQFSPEQTDSSGVPIELPVKAALAIFQALNCPGKLLVFHAAPLIEMGTTQTSSGFFGSSKPKSIFQPSEGAVSLVRDCVRQGCSVHLFHLSQELVGGAWPGHIPYLTGGALNTYNHLQGEMDKERFSADLKRTFAMMDTGFRAELKICVSKDMRVLGCYGLFLPGPNPSSVPMAAVDWRTTLALELEHIRNLDEKKGVVIQTGLSYSTSTGERRTRVHTVVLKCSRHLQDAFRHYQAQTLLTFYSKKMYCAVLERPLQELREELQTQITEALACYRKHCCSASVSAGQLVLPQYLRALPVYINSLRKSEVLLPGLRSSVPQRLQQRCQVLNMDPTSTAIHFYPQLLRLPLTVDSSDPPKLEEAIRCCSASLESEGLYLVNAPLTLLLWVGRQVPTGVLMELFNTSFFYSLPSGEVRESAVGGEAR